MKKLLNYFMLVILILLSQLLYSQDVFYRPKIDANVYTKNTADTLATKPDVRTTISDSLNKIALFDTTDASSYNSATGKTYYDPVTGKVKIGKDSVGTSVGGLGIDSTKTVDDSLYLKVAGNWYGPLVRTTPPFIPTDFDSLTVWFESRFYNYTDSASVPNWRDTSGNGLHLTLTNVRWIDSTFGATGSYRFWHDSSSKGRNDLIANYITGNDIPITVFAVVKVIDFPISGGYERQWYFLSDDVSWTYIYGFNNFGNTLPQFNSTRKDGTLYEVRPNIGADTTTLKNGAVITQRFDGDSVKGYINSALISNGLLETNPLELTEFFIGVDINIHYGAVLIYRRYLSDSECEQVRNYLIGKYGL